MYTRIHIDVDEPPRSIGDSTLIAVFVLSVHVDHASGLRDVWLSLRLFCLDQLQVYAVLFQGYGVAST